MTDYLDIQGFTDRPLSWRAWLPVVSLDQATAEQIAVLESSHPQAKVSDYYRLLVWQPLILEQRSAAFNGIMYAPGGLARSDRELASTVVSRINGCVYCASVHAQRYQQLSKQLAPIPAVFADPLDAGDTPRERAIAQFSAGLTVAPEEIGPDDLQSLYEAGLSDLEILDLIHSVAIFAWANRLMLNLGEPEVAPE